MLLKVCLSLQYLVVIFALQDILSRGQNQWLSRSHCGTARNSKLNARMSLLHPTEKVFTMPDSDGSKTELLRLLRKKSVDFGSFTLSSGATSSYYVDCKLTTLTPRGALLVGVVFYKIIHSEELSLGVQIDAVGGLTMGADPISLAVGMISFQNNPSDYYEVFSVRKRAKEHGQHKLIEGNFHEGYRVVVIDDVRNSWRIDFASHQGSRTRRRVSEIRCCFS
jgi:orotate phosphoribosyltransferase